VSISLSISFYNLSQETLLNNAPYLPLLDLELEDLMTYLTSFIY